MFALKLQKLTTRTFLRPFQPRLVQGSTIIIRTHKHGWRTTKISRPHRKLPPSVPSVTHERSPRVRSDERQGSNNRDSEKASSSKDKFSLGKLSVGDLLIICCWVNAAVIELCIHILRHGMWLTAPTPVVKDVLDVTREENAMWFDQYIRENGERKSEEDDER